MNRKSYPSDLSNQEWEQVWPLLQEGVYRKAGSKRKIF